MEGSTYFFVEHDITDKQGWDGWMSNWFDIYGKSNMTTVKMRTLSIDSTLLYYAFDILSLRIQAPMT